MRGSPEILYISWKAGLLQKIPCVYHLPIMGWSSPVKPSRTIILGVGYCFAVNISGNKLFLGFTKFGMLGFWPAPTHSFQGYIRPWHFGNLHLFPCTCVAEVRLGPLQIRTSLPFTRNQSNQRSESQLYSTHHHYINRRTRSEEASLTTSFFRISLISCQLKI